MVPALTEVCPDTFDTAEEEVHAAAGIRLIAAMKVKKRILSRSTERLVSRCLFRALGALPRSQSAVNGELLFCFLFVSGSLKGRPERVVNFRISRS